MKINQPKGVFSAIVNRTTALCSSEPGKEVESKAQLRVISTSKHGQRFPVLI